MKYITIDKQGSADINYCFNLLIRWPQNSITLSRSRASLVIVTVTCQSRLVNPDKTCQPLGWDGHHLGTTIQYIKRKWEKLEDKGLHCERIFFFFWNCLRWRCEILIFRYLWSCHSRLCATRTRDRYLFLDKHISEALVCVWWGPRRARPKALSGLWYRVRWSSSGLLKGQITPGRGCTLLVQSPEERESKSPEHGHG